MNFPNINSAYLATNIAGWVIQSWAFIDGYHGFDNSALHTGAAKNVYNEHWLQGANKAAEVKAAAAKRAQLNSSFAAETGQL
jgi:hypothetical protein